MGKGDYLGEFEQLVMLAILRLGSNAYGMTIREVINARISREATIGSVYAAVERLLEKGFLHPRIGDATPERGGRAKRFVELTGDGKRALAESEAAFAKMRAGLTRKLAWGRS